MSIFEHYRENSTDMFPGQIADMIETKTLPKLFELTNNLRTNIVPMLYEASMSFAKGLFNLFIAFIVSIYMTIDKFILKNDVFDLYFLTDSQYNITNVKKCWETIGSCNL